MPTCDDQDLIELLWQQLELAGQAQQHESKFSTLTQEKPSPDTLTPAHTHIRVMIGPWIRQDP